jgi:hypothetical protein
MANISIGLIAALNDVCPDVVRRAEVEGAIPKARRSPGGHRRWDVSQLEAIRQGLARRKPAEPSTIEKGSR